MLRQLKASSALGMVILLSACGGGGGSGTTDSGSSTSEQKKTEESSQASKILTNAIQHTPEELIKAAYSLVEHGYAGKSNVVQLNEIVVGQASVTALLPEYRHIFSDDQIRNFLSLNDVTGKSFTCGVSGSVDIHSKWNEQGIRVMSLDFNNCVTSSVHWMTISGVLALSSESYKQKSYYFDELDIDGVKVTGYTQEYSSESDSGGHEDVKRSHLLYSYKDGRNIKVELEESSSAPNRDTQATVGVKGTVWLSESGKVKISSQGLKSSYNGFYTGSLSFKADTEIQLSFSDKFFTYKKDLDGDGSFELGTHLSKVSGFQFALMQPVDLYPLALLSQPPAFNSTPTQSSYDVNTETPIVVESSEFSDPDTRSENLQLSYRWYINGEIVTGETTNTLPAYTAAYGDEVKVQAVVFDGTSSITSEWAYIYLNDIKPVIKTKNLPDQILAGDELKFSVSWFDLDVNRLEKVRMVSGPEGATMSSDGVISWTAPSESDFLIPVQVFEFTFKTLDDDYQEATLGVEVKSNRMSPIVRSGEISPLANDSIVIDDFDGDGLKEFLTTDNGNGLYLYNFENGQYNQKWMYPYTLPINGSIEQLYYLDIDNDLKKEIILVTSKNILTLEELSSSPKVVFDTPKHILRVAIEDVNEDGAPEVAILQYEDDVSRSTLSVYRWNDFSSPVLNELDANGSSLLSFSNVDNDQPIELILKGGLVIDTSTWEVQWDYGEQFSQRGMVIGDFNQDGVNEIFGMYHNGDLYRYSVVAKTATEILSTQYLSSCVLEKSQLSINTDDLLLMSCPYSGIKAFKIEGDALTQRWHLSFSFSGRVNSLTSGDIDNDNQFELLWGTSGHYSKSGFASADVSNISAIMNHSTVTKSSSSFKAIGWGNTTPEKEDALFLVGKYDDDGVRNRFVTVSSDGRVNISSGTSSTYNPLVDTVHIDSNEDGYSEIVLPEIGYQNSKMDLVQISDELVTSTHELSAGTGSQIVKAADFNKDGKKDIVIAHGSQITVYDVANNTSIATLQAPSEHRYIQDLEVYDESSGVIIATDGYNMSILEIVGNSLTSKFTGDFPSPDCKRIFVFNYDSDIRNEIGCFNSFGTLFSIFEVADNEITLKESNNMKFYAKGVAVDPSSASEQNLIIISKESTNSDPWGAGLYHVRKTDNKGNTIWKSPPLIGEPSSHGIKIRNHPEKGLQALLSTDQAMYQINP